MRSCRLFFFSRFWKQRESELCCERTRTLGSPTINQDVSLQGCMDGRGSPIVKNGQRKLGYSRDGPAVDLEQYEDGEDDSINEASGSNTVIEDRAVQEQCRSHK